LAGHSAGAQLCTLTVVYDAIYYLKTRFISDPAIKPNEGFGILPNFEDCLPQISGMIL